LDFNIPEVRHSICIAKDFRIVHLGVTCCGLIIWLREVCRMSAQTTQLGRLCRICWRWPELCKRPLRSLTCPSRATESAPKADWELSVRWRTLADLTLSRTDTNVGFSRNWRMPGEQGRVCCTRSERWHSRHSTSSSSPQHSAKRAREFAAPITNLWHIPQLPDGQKGHHNTPYHFILAPTLSGRDE
jgi:hypothetical protein